MSQSEQPTNYFELGNSNYQSTVETKLSNELLAQCVDFYFSTADTIHEQRRKCLKRQTFRNRDELLTCLQDPLIQKIVVTDQSGNLGGVMMVAKPSETISKYSPSHLLRIEADGNMPFFRGTQGWPGHYQALSLFTPEYLEKYSHMLAKQKGDLKTTIPPLTRLNPNERMNMQTLIDSGQLYICIDNLIINIKDVEKIHQQFLIGLQTLTNSVPGLLLHHYPDTEISDVKSLSNISGLKDTVDAQAY